MALTSSEAWLAYLSGMARFHRYSPTNVAMILKQRPDATQVAGFRVWQSMGRQVRKGSKGIAIWAPCSYKVERQDADGEITEAKALGGFRLAHVFDVADTDGEPLPEAPRAARATLLAGEAPAGMWEYLAGQVAKHGYKLELVPDLGGANGRTTWAGRLVQVVDDGRGPASMAKTLAHELGHVLLHADLVGAGCLEAKEVEAESVAYLIGAAFGLDTTDYSLGYVTSWSGGDHRVILATAKRVMEAATSALADLEESGADAGHVEDLAQGVEA
jgi:antirestriction protein ArdC